MTINKDNDKVLDTQLKAIETSMTTMAAMGAKPLRTTETEISPASVKPISMKEGSLYVKGESIRNVYPVEHDCNIKLNTLIKSVDTLLAELTKCLTSNPGLSHTYIKNNISSIRALIRQADK